MKIEIELENAGRENVEDIAEAFRQMMLRMDGTIVHLVTHEDGVTGTFRFAVKND